MTPLLDLVERGLDRARQSSDVVLAVVMAMVIGAMIVPLPAWLVDVGLAINLAAALSLLVAALYAKDALKVAAFPTLLLITTLFRLAMNVSSTRLALSEGHAGDVIQAFGEFVVRGDYVVGAVIFAILTLVQFLVVAKGAERVAEVSARFTLDAMPGKQMSIDADLRAGAITQDQARTRRRHLERESQLFGSMDGAMKFVKGDVIAGLVIMLINLLGGTVIGVLQNGLTLSDAAATYALISIGDGLVSQIPSLCIAVAAGIVVTRVASETDEANLGLDIGTQFFGQWKALLVVSALCVAVGLMPGMPHFTFVIIASLAAAVGVGLKRLQERDSQRLAVQPQESAQAPGEPAPDGAPQHSGVAPLTLDLAADLDWLVKDAGGRFATDDLSAVREQLYLELGVRVPAFRVRTGAPLAARSWALGIDEVPSGRQTVPEGHCFAQTPPEQLSLLGLAGSGVPDPAGGPEWSAVDAAGAGTLAAMQMPTISPREYVARQVTALLRKRTAAFLGVQEVQASLTALEAQCPTLVKESLTKVPLPLLTDVLRRLLHEQVSIRNLRAILEALVSPQTEGDATQLTERCRQALARQLSHQHASDGTLYAFLVDPAVEETLRQAGPGGAVDPADAAAILEGLRRLARRGKAVLLASPDIRRLLKRLVEGALPEVAVLAYGELDAELQVRPVGRLVPVPAR